MHLWGAKTLLTWTEPKLARETREALAHEDSSIAWRILWAVGIGLIFLLRIGVRFGKKNNWPLILIVGLLAVLGFLYIRPRLWSLFPSVIQVTEKAVSQTVANRSTAWKFADVATCRLIDSLEGDESPTLLALELKESETVILGIAPTVNLDELERVLAVLLAQSRST